MCCYHHTRRESRPAHAAIGLALLLATITASPASSADELAIELGELDAALEAARNGGSPLQQLLAEKVQQALSEAGLQLTQGRLLYSETIEDVELDGGCSDTTLRTMDLNVALNAGTRFAFTLNALTEPIVLATQIDASVDADGEARQRYGVEVFGNCSRYAQDTFSFTVDGPLQLAVSLTVTLNPEFLPEGVRITPRFVLTGELLSYALDVDVDDTIVAGLVEDYIEEELEDQLSGDALQDVLAGVQADLQQAVIDSWGADNRLYTLPEIGDVQLASLLDIVSQQASFPILLDYVADNQLELLLALLTGDDELLNQIVQSASACEASAVLLAELAHEPLFAREDESCVTADLSDPAARDYYSDAECRDPVAYQATPYPAFCAQALDKSRLGNAADIDAEPRHWTLTPGTRFDISVVPVGGNRQPFMQRVRYKSVADCHLEMRIYKRSLTATGLTPLLALHGGSWRYRSATFYTLEAQVSHFTERGFIVFAPFYRLADTKDGNPECHGALSDDLLADVDDALAWILNNGAEHGAATATVDIFGQSAGGHLGGWLAVQRAASVGRALLLYPPVDLSDFLSRYRDGLYDNTLGLESLQSFLGTPLDALDPADPVVANNSFPQQVAADPGAFPRLFLLHGQADALVPARQSVRLCNALSGSPDNGPAGTGGGNPDAGSARNVIACDDRGSYLHLLAQADHGLDVCIGGVVCPAGDEQGQAAASDSFTTALQWLTGTVTGPVDDVATVADSDVRPSSSAIDDAALLGLLLLIWLRRVTAARTRAAVSYRSGR